MKGTCPRKYRGFFPWVASSMLTLFCCILGVPWGGWIPLNCTFILTLGSFQTTGKIFVSSHSDVLVLREWQLLHIKKSSRESALSLSWLRWTSSCWVDTRTAKCLVDLCFFRRFVCYIERISSLLAGRRRGQNRWYDLWAANTTH